jgi:hypothetical protein
MSMTTERLYVSHPDRPAYPDTLDIKTEQTVELLDTAFRFRIIGNSHFITAAALGFAELVSCEPPGDGLVTEVPLQQGHHETISADVGAVTLETDVRCLPFEAFPRDQQLTVRYRFDEDAYTAIAVSRDSGAYTTYHTYPEYDLVVYTESHLTVRTDVASYHERDSRVLPTEGESP